MRDANRWDKKIICLIILSSTTVKTQSSCGVLNDQNTNGIVLQNNSETFYTANPLITYSNKTLFECTMVFTSGSKYLSMNVVEHSSGVSCNMFEKKETDDEQEGILIQKQSSTYYEKRNEFIKGNPSVIAVHTKDERPGNLIFRLPTAKYTIKLVHVSGALACNNLNLASPFGCFWNTDLIDGGNGNMIMLTEEFRGRVVAYTSHFNQFEDATGFTTSSVTTCECFTLIQGLNYSFWYEDDYSDRGEYDNSGTTTFEMHVKPCI